MNKIFKVTPNKASKVKEFCLKQIKIEYGYDYNKDWHADLDSLTDKDGMYYENKKGSFYFVEINNNIVATSALRHLKYKPSCYDLFVSKLDNSNVASLWRTYTDLQHRNKGLASNMLEKIDDDISSFGYEFIYLHTSYNKPDSLKFWENKGFEIFHEDANDDRTVHMYKKVK